MQRNSWFNVCVKLLAVMLILAGLHKSSLVVSVMQDFDVSYLTSFHPFDVSDVVAPLHLATVDDDTSLLVHQVDQKMASETLETSEPDTQTENTPQTENTQTPTPTGKRIYIYNTHQYEGYATNNVMDAADYLSGQLRSLGYEVIVEKADFEAYRLQVGDTGQSRYPTSRIFMEQQLATYGSFDLIIDLHRDSISKDLSTANVDGVTYAKMMMVIGMASANASEVASRSAVIHEEVDRLVNGVMRSDYQRASGTYNQQYADHMVLIECGGPENTYEEVTRSMDLLAKAIDAGFKGGRL